MMQAIRWTCVGLLMMGVVLLAQLGAGSAQDKKDVKKEVKKEEKKETKKETAKDDKKKKDKKDRPPYEKHDATALNNSLRDVINVGVKMFNEQGDYAGCYRLFQGSLLSVRPFLAPDLQKKIDQGLANAEKMRNYADRAYELRGVLDEIRAALPGGPATVEKKAADKGQVSGKVSFQNKAVPGGYFVTLIGADGKMFSSALQKDGSFQFKTQIAPGKYNVIIQPIPGEPVKGVALPERYSSDSGSGIVIQVQAGKQKVDLNLVK